MLFYSKGLLVLFYTDTGEHFAFLKHAIQSNLEQVAYTSFSRQFLSRLQNEQCVGGLERHCELRV